MAYIAILKDGAKIDEYKIENDTFVATYALYQAKSLDCISLDFTVSDSE